MPTRRTSSETAAPLKANAEAVEKVNLDRIRCVGRKYDSMNQKGGGE
jgi:hypothetical protein